MLVFGTEMHVITLVFICLEFLLLFYLLIHRLQRPDDNISFLDIFLIVLLVIYNLTGGLLPDPELPGSYFMQNSIAYATGFMTPCYFPYYVYKAFALERMKFHAYRGVFFFLIGPYLLFVLVFAASGNLDTAKNLLGLPVIYAVWVIYTLVKAVQEKYRNNFSTSKSRIETIFLFFSLTPWVALPVIDYFNLGQPVEVSLTNTGFLLLLGLHLKKNVEQVKAEHRTLKESQLKLSNWDEQLQQEITKRINQNPEERFIENCKNFQLTAREKEIASLICQGFTHRIIGQKLYISEKTVAKHAQHIFEKVGVSNKVELYKKLDK